MYRQQIINHRGRLLSPDTAKALDALTVKASEAGWRLDVLGPTPADKWDPMSMVVAGREMELRLIRSDIEDPQLALNALWGFAVPLGFTPWLRYPIAGDRDQIFHYFGLWRILYDRLMSEGRGHLCWPSLCAAAQCDMGMWQGTKADERFVQAQLHRMGRNCGPIDGVIGARTADAIETLGLPNSGFPQVLEYLRTADPPPAPKMPRQVGHIAVPSRNIAVAAFGDIKTVRTMQGATLTIDGPGRVILDVGAPT